MANIKTLGRACLVSFFGKNYKEELKLLYKKNCTKYEKIKRMTYLVSKTFDSISKSLI